MGYRLRVRRLKAEGLRLKKKSFPSALSLSFLQPFLLLYLFASLPLSVADSSPEKLASPPIGLVDMKETLYLIPVGHVQYSLMERLAKSLQERFNITCKISTEFQIPPEAYDRKRDQFYSSIILKRLKDFPLQTDSILKLGVTEHDLYVPSLNFVFGEARPEDGIAIISLQRLRQEYYGLDENEEKLHRRMVTEAVHELGHVYGLMHCSNPKCVMFFSNMLADTDKKSDKFCEKCGKIFEKTRCP